jgi:uncharacterized protein
MFSLQRVFGKEDKFFDLLESSAREALNAAVALKKLCSVPGQPAAFSELARSHEAQEAITRQMNELLCAVFVTAIEREDLQLLSTALYKISKTIEKTGERLLLAPDFLYGVDLSRQIDMFERAVEIVGLMLRELRQGATLARIKEINERLQHIEGQGDDLLRDRLTELYSGGLDEGRALYLKDIFELLEKVTDRCRNAGNLIIGIALRNY